MNVAEVLRAVSTLAWLLAFLVIGLAVFRAAGNQTFKPAGTLVAVGIVTALVLTAVSAGLVFIQPEERGVEISAVASGGYRTEPLGPGLHWIIPFAENVTPLPDLHADLHHVDRPERGCHHGRRFNRRPNG